MIPAIRKKYCSKYIVHPDWQKKINNKAIVLIDESFYRTFTTFGEQKRLAKYSRVDSKNLTPIKNGKCMKCNENKYKFHLIFQNPKWCLSHNKCVWFPFGMCKLPHYIATKSNVSLKNNDVFVCENCLFKAKLLYKNFVDTTSYSIKIQLL